MFYSDLGTIFASGNLHTAFNGFTTDHKCNKFCNFFSLPTDYATWVTQFPKGGEALPLSYLEQLDGLKDLDGEELREVDEDGEADMEISSAAT